MVSILKTLDDLNVFPRYDGGPTPALVLDRHQSILEASFVEYFNGEGQKWFALLSVPYATSYWQVRDSLEHNWALKIAWCQEKEKLVEFMSNTGINPLTIKNDHMIALINATWDDSLGNVQNSKNIITNRGWYSANTIFLDHPEITTKILFTAIASNNTPSVLY